MAESCSDAIPSGEATSTTIIAQPEGETEEMAGERPLRREVQPQQVVGDTDITDDSNDYEIYRNGVKRLVVTIINLKFPEQFANRDYALLDKYTNGFKEKFGFQAYNPLGKETDYVLDATLEDFDIILEKTKERLRNENIGCLVFIVSSHGGEVDHVNREGERIGKEHCIICSDGTKVKTKKIMETFEVGKIIPKVFVIQACRSDSTSSCEEKVDVGVILAIKDENSDDEAETDVPRVLHTQQPQSETDPAACDIIPENRPVTSVQGNQDNPGNPPFKLPEVPPCAPDTTIIFGCAAGKIAYKQLAMGSWILDSLNSTIEEMTEPEIPLFALLNRVNCKQSSQQITQKTLLKATGSYAHQMTKPLILKKCGEDMDTS